MTREEFLATTKPEEIETELEEMLNERKVVVEAVFNALLHVISLNYGYAREEEVAKFTKILVRENDTKSDFINRCYEHCLNKSVPTPESTLITLVCMIMVLFLLEIPHFVRHLKAEEKLAAVLRDMEPKPKWNNGGVN